jgi:TPP-dependent indolepyruvate ferredoxin oxidoreductase alpha subunit
MITSALDTGVAEVSPKWQHGKPTNMNPKALFLVAAFFSAIVLNSLAQSAISGARTQSPDQDVFQLHWLRQGAELQLNWPGSLRKADGSTERPYRKAFNMEEAIDLMVLSFDLAEKYRTICMVILDGCVGQMMEPAKMPEMRPIQRGNWDWATDGRMGKRERRVLTSIYLDPIEEEKTNLRLLSRWKTIQREEVRYKEYFLDDAEFVIIGFGTAGRVALSAVRQARQMGIKVGLLRPITVSPFPFEVVEQLVGRVSGFLVTEMNSGQMLDDVRLAVKGRAPVEFYGRMGGVVPFTEEILHEIERIASSKLSVETNPRDAWLERMAQA